VTPTDGADHGSGTVYLGRSPELPFGVGHPIGLGLLAAGLYGVVYFAAAAGFGVREGRQSWRASPRSGAGSARIGRPLAARR
jgi:hypothetical protein